MSRFLTEKIKKIKPYTPGEQPKERKYIKLNTNESPFPPSQKAVELAKAELERLMLYPDPDCKDLTALMADTLGVKPSNVLMGNGSDEILYFAFMAYTSENKPAIFPDITYGFYKVFADIVGVPYKEIPLNSSFCINIEDYLEAEGVLFIANPNAPTGIGLSIDDIELLLKANPNRVVVVDEAYVDFGEQSAVCLTKKYDNLLVCGTFSKSRSMAGARLGYAVASEEIIKDLTSIKYSTNPYNVNRLTAAAGVGALMDKEYFNKNCACISLTREWFKVEIEKLGFEFTPSIANFLFVKHNNIGGEELYLKLKDRGILVRHFSSPRITEYNRITIGSKEQMQELLNNIKEILAEGEQK